MTIDLTDTTTGAIHDALTQARRRLGGPASGMVLTLIIVTDEAAQYDAVRAASQAGREHPSRVLAVITRRPKAESRLDAEIRVGETGPGEIILLRMYGPLGQHADSVVAPLLAPDVPVVTWWPDDAPPAPRADPLGCGRPAPGDRRGGERRAQGDAADPGQGLPARRHRPELDPVDVLAHLARRHPGPALPRAAQRRGPGRAGQPDRGPDRGLARPAAGHRGAARRVRRPRDHRGQLRHAGREDRRCRGRTAGTPPWPGPASRIAGWRCTAATPRT